MNFAEVKELVNLIDKSSVMHFSVEMDNARIVIDRNRKADPYSMQHQQFGSYLGAPYAMPQPQFVPEATNSSIVAMPETTPQPAAAAPAEAQSGHIVKSPIVGTFYPSPAQDKPAFAPIGTKVKKGDVLCILEAMKIMNEIVSDADGTVAEVYFQSGDMVEALAPLFLIT